MNDRNYLTILFLTGLFIVGSMAGAASVFAAPMAEADTSSTSQTGWGWFYNQTVDQINAAKANGTRPIRLIPNGEIEAVPRYHVLYVANTGQYQVGDWQVVVRTLQNAETLPSPAFRSSNWRITNVAVHEMKDTVNGKPVTAKRAVTLMVKETAYLDYDVRVWLSLDALKALGNQYRVVDFDAFETNGATYYSAIIVPNTGEHAKKWGWLFNTTRSNITNTAKNINGTAYRVSNIERHRNGNYDALLIEDKGEVDNWYTNLTDEGLKNDVLRRHGTYYGGPFNGGVRFFDLVAYKDSKNVQKFDVLALENGSGKYVVAHSGTGFEDIEAAFQKVMSRHGIPGATFALSKNGKTIYQAGFGMSDLASGAPANATSKGRIASISKTITTAVLMKLYEQGKVDLENKVFAPGGYLSSIKPFDYDGYKGNIVPNLEKITLRNLLNHTGGWDRQKSGDPNAPQGSVCDGGSECEPTMYILPRILAHAKKQKTVDANATQLASIDDIIRFMIKPDDKDYLPSYAPGTKFAYSNFGFTCVQKIIEVISGKSYEQNVQDMGSAMGVQFSAGRSKPENKLPLEWTYTGEPGSNGTTNVAWSSVALDEPVPVPYSRDMKMLLGHGGWVETPGDLLKFLSKVDGTAANPWIKEATFLKMMERPSYMNGSDKSKAYYGLCWRVEPLGVDPDKDKMFNISHGGSLEGSSSLTLKSMNVRKVKFAYLFNAREDAADGEIKKAIEPLITAMDDKGLLAAMIK